jgi:hypothetical protein
MKLRHIIRTLTSPPLPPVAQTSRGLERDADFRPPEPGFLETLFAWGSDGRRYEMDAADAKRLRPVFLKSERTIRNEKIALERARRRGDAPLPVNFAQDAPPIDGNRGASVETAFPEAWGRNSSDAAPARS